MCCMLTSMLTTYFVEICWDLLRLAGCWDQFLLIFFLYVYFFKIKTNMADFRLFQANLLIFLKSNFDEVWIVRKKLLKQKLFIHIISLMSHSFTAEMWFVWRRECPNHHGLFDFTWKFTKMIPYDHLTINNKYADVKHSVWFYLKLQST